MLLGSNIDTHAEKVSGPAERGTVDLLYFKLSIDGFCSCWFKDWRSQSSSIDLKSGFTSRKATAIPIMGREYRTVAVASNT